MAVFLSKIETIESDVLLANTFAIAHQTNYVSTGVENQMSLARTIFDTYSTRRERLPGTIDIFHILGKSSIINMNVQ